MKALKSKTTNRTLAVILAAIMLLSMIPFSAIAADIAETDGVPDSFTTDAPPASSISIPVTIWDQWDDDKMFEGDNNGAAAKTGLVNSKLIRDTVTGMWRPERSNSAYSGANHPLNFTDAELATWYTPKTNTNATDKNATNMVQGSLTFGYNAVTGTYTYTNEKFYPLDQNLASNSTQNALQANLTAADFTQILKYNVNHGNKSTQAPNSSPNPTYGPNGEVNNLTSPRLYGDGNHNYHFTMHMETWFTYKGGETFKFSGDDDVWVFIDGKLALDLGGTHTEVSDTITFGNDGKVKSDTVNGGNWQDLKLVIGQSYRLNFYYAERHVYNSKLTINTTLQIDDFNVDKSGVLNPEKGEIDYIVEVENKLTNKPISITHIADWMNPGTEYAEEGGRFIPLGSEIELEYKLDGGSNWDTVTVAALNGGTFKIIGGGNGADGTTIDIPASSSVFFRYTYTLTAADKAAGNVYNKFSVKTKSSGANDNTDIKVGGDDTSTPLKVDITIPIKKTIELADGSGGYKQDDVLTFYLYEATANWEKVDDSSIATVEVSASVAEGGASFELKDLYVPDVFAGGTIYFIAEEGPPPNAAWTVNTGRLYFAVTYNAETQTAEVRAVQGLADDAPRVADTFVNTYCDNPTIEVTKRTVDAEGNETTHAYTVGEMIIYEIEFEVGSIPIKGIEVTETFGGTGELKGPWMSKSDIGKDDKIRTPAQLADFGSGTGFAAWMPANSTGKLYYTYVVSAEDANSQTIRNEVTVKGFTPDGFDNPYDDDDVVTPLVHPSISIEKTVITGQVPVEVYDDGANVQYQITVTNSGEATAKGVVVTDTLSDVAENVMISINDGAATAFAFKTVSVDGTSFDLAPGQSAVITYTVKVVGLSDEDALDAYNTAKAELEIEIAAATAAVTAEQTELDELLAMAVARKAALATLLVQDSVTDPGAEPTVPGAAPEAPVQADFADDDDAFAAAYDDYLTAYDEWFYANEAYTEWAAKKAAFDGFNETYDPETHAASVVAAQVLVDEIESDEDGTLGADIAAAEAAVDAAKVTLASLAERLEALEFTSGGQLNIIKNTATATLPNYDGGEDDETIKVGPQGASALAISKKVRLADTDDYETSVVFGTSDAGIAFYQITVTNKGTAKSEGLTVTDVLDGKAVVAIDATYVIDDVEKGEFEFGTTVFSLEAGKSAVITYSVAIPENTERTTANHVNVATVTDGDDDSASNYAYVAVPAKPYAEIVLDKVVVIGSTQEGDIVTDNWVYYNDGEPEVTYRVTVANIGTGLGNFTLTDNLLGEGKFTDAQGNEYNNGDTIVLGAGDKLVLYYTLTLSTDDDGNAKTYVNTATATTDDGKKVEDGATVTIKPLPQAILSIDKQVKLTSADDSTYTHDHAAVTVSRSVGKADFTFKITITNKGDAAAKVWLDDIMNDNRLGENDAGYNVTATMLSGSGYTLISEGSGIVIPADDEVTIFVNAAVPVGAFTNTVTIMETSTFGDDVCEIENRTSSATVTVRYSSNPGPGPGTETGTDPRPPVVTLENDPAPQGEFPQDVTEVIEEPQTPLSEFVAEVEEDFEFEEEVPLGALQTGDSNSLVVFAAVMVFAALGLAILWITKGKKTKA